MTLPVIFRDADYVAVHKPPGLLMHRSPLSRDRVFLLQTLRDQIGQRVFPVHRLDRATSGIVVLGLHAEAARRLADAFMHRQVGKSYRALVRGWVHGAGTIDHPLRDADSQEGSRNARTHYRGLARVELEVAVDRYPTSRYSLVDVVPETGRRHQIRKHFKHISHHLIGDTTHGNGRHNRYFRDQLGIQRLMLTSAALAFRHPFTGENLSLAAREEPEWQRVFEQFGWDPALLPCRTRAQRPA